MDRMTIRGDHGVFLEPKWDFGIDPDDYDTVQKILGRLAMFEDLLENNDMEPDEFVKAMKRTFNDESLLRMTAQFLGTTPERLKELVKAEKYERLIIMPASTVFELTWDADAGCDFRCPDGIGEDGCNQSCPKAGLFVYERKCKQEHLPLIGKTVFLTFEEAEAAREKEVFKKHES